MPGNCTPKLSLVSTGSAATITLNAVTFSGVTGTLGSAVLSCPVTGGGSSTCTGTSTIDAGFYTLSAPVQTAALYGVNFSCQ